MAVITVWPPGNPIPSPESSPEIVAGTRLIVMASTPVGSNVLIQEVLQGRDNYERWSLRVQAYLLSEDLWDVVQETTEPPKLEDDQAGYMTWTKKNAKALYAIRNSCGPDMFSFISKTGSAKIAWEALEQKLKIRPEFDILDHSAGYSSDVYLAHTNLYERFMEYVDCGKWEKAKKCLEEFDLRSVVVKAREGTYSYGSNNTAIRIAARKGHAHIVKDLAHFLLTPEDWKRTGNFSGQTALHIAACNGHYQVVKEFPVDLMGEVQDIYGNTALHIAVQEGNVDVVKELVLLMRQEDLKIKNHEGLTALHLAVNKEVDMSIIKELVIKAEGRVNIHNEQEFKQYESPFITYLREGNWHKANEFLRQLGDDALYGAMIAVARLRDTIGCTALHEAAKKGHLDVVKGLLSMWVKIRKRNLDLKSTQDFTREDDFLVSDGLLMKRAKCMVEEFESTLEGLLEIQDHSGDTALHIAVIWGKVEIVKELAPMMRRKEGLEIRNRSGWSALHTAVIYQSKDIVKELIPLMREQGLEIKDNDGYTTIHRAISQVNVDIVKEFLDLMRTEGFEVKNNLGYNALHQAFDSGHTLIIKELMLRIRPEAWEATDHQGFTPLCHAIRSFNDDYVREIAEDIARKTHRVFGIPSTGQELDEDGDEIPVVQALRLNKWELAGYLYKLTPLKFLKGSHGSAFLCYCFACKQFELAWDLLHRYPHLAVTVHGKDKTSPMLILSRMSYAFLSGSQLTRWQRWIYNCIPIGKIIQVDIHGDISIHVADHQYKRDHNFSVIRLIRRLADGICKLCGIWSLYEMKRTHKMIFEILRCMAKPTKSDHISSDQLDTIKSSFFAAIQQGHFELVTYICKEDTKILSRLLEDKRVKGIFHYAVESRLKEVYSLIYGIEEKERHELGISLVNGDYTLLHYAANLSSHPQLDHIQDAGLQMQRELQWFKEVESIVPPELYEHRERSNDMTTRELFTENHKKLLEDAEISIKGTATSCTVVGALIVTMMFAAAFTVPGGNNSDKGYPIFLHHKLFKVYIVSVTTSLVSSTSSVITFLGILTSRYAERDFLTYLPTKIMIGLITLFAAIVSMVMAFSCALILMLGRERWVESSIVFTSVPVILFVWLLFPLLFKTFKSTYGPEMFDKKQK